MTWGQMMSDLSVQPRLDESLAAFGDLQAKLDGLDDDLDHPEVWTALAACAQAPGADALLAAMSGVRPLAGGRAAKTTDIALAVLTAAIHDQARGMEMIKQLESVHPLCPQVAGACFFVSRLGDPTRTADLSAKFCDSPFIKFETLIDGTVAPCCSIWTKKRLGHLERQSFDEIWNSKDAVEMRESILDGSYRYCNKQRCTRILEDTLDDRAAVVDPDMRAAIDGHKTVLDHGPKWLFLAHDLTCNLACPSCRGGLMGADEAQEARFTKVEENVFFPLLSGDGAVTLSLSGQGDPWSSQHYRSILRHLADHDVNVQLNLHTNALLMSEQRWNSYRGLEKYRPLVDVSIDACSPWVYAVVRRPGKWEKLEPNLRFIAARRRAGIFREYHINATIQLDNFHEMPALVDFAEDLGADSVRLYMMQNTGGHLVDFAAKNIGDQGHPLHLAFLETLRDPKLARPIAHLYDVATWRDIALEAALPSDRLGADFSYDDLCFALSDAIEAGEPERAAALCVAGRIRFGDDVALLRMEGRLLDHLGFERQAGYRDAHADALEARLGAAPVTLAAE